MKFGIGKKLCRSIGKHESNSANMGKQRRTNGMSDLLQMFDSYLTLWVPCHITAIGVALYTFTGVVSKYE